uniref:Uncharacterized protein n=1 Tax=Nelumbo nucifera TaxID=4432 RepID=A0A822ZJR3_NELNU|nr:TPA_asm: hypothetical protein HUJ06_003010 [Nelumbo nucifera]
MMCSMRQSATILTISNLSRSRPNAYAPQSRLSLLPPISFAKGPNFDLSACKPLYISSLQGFGSSKGARPRKSVIECKAHRANRPQPIDANVEDADLGGCDIPVGAPSIEVCS